MILRKILNRLLLTNQVSRWEKARNYPIREQSFSLPQITVNPHAGTTLLIMSATDHIQDAAWTAQSLLRHLPAAVGLTLVVDGEAPPARLQAFQALFPGAEVTDSSAISEKAKGICPIVAAAGEKHPMVRKLAAVLVSQYERHTLYSDSDITCFGPIPEVVQAIHEARVPLYMDSSSDSFDQKVVERARELGQQVTPGLNAGFLYIPKRSLDIGLAEKLLEGFDFEKCNPATWWWVEQSIVSVLMHQNGAQPLPQQRYVLNNARQFYHQKDVDYDQIALRHFVSSVRQLLFIKGMPRVLQQIQADPSPVRPS